MKNSSKRHSFQFFSLFYRACNCDAGERSKATANASASQSLEKVRFLHARTPDEWSRTKLSTTTVLLAQDRGRLVF